MLDSVLTLWPPRILGAPLVAINVMDGFRKFSWYAKDPKKVSPIIYFFLFGTVNLESNNKLEDLAAMQAYF